MKAETNTNLIVRVNAPTRRLRISVPDTGRLCDLKDQISLQVDIPPQNLKLSFSSSGLPELQNDQEKLKSLGFKGGDLVFLSSTLPFPQPDTSNNHQPKSETNNEEESNNAQDESVESKKGFHKSDANEPTFKSFDAFIKERGYNTSDLAHRLSYAPSTLTRGTLNKVPQSVSLKHQSYRHVDHLELMNISEVKNFVMYWNQDLDMLSSRVGWMFGYYKEDDHYPMGIRAVCEAIYEPPQVSSDGRFSILTDDFMPSVIQIAKTLNLELIGWIYTHLPRDELLTADEVVEIARLQLKTLNSNHFSGYPSAKFVTCTIAPDATGEPVPNAFMVSDMGMALVRDGLIVDHQPDPTHMALRSASKNELLPQVLESGKETTKFDADWFVVRVNESAPIVVRSVFKSTSQFPVENRKVPQTATDVKAYFNTVRRTAPGESWKKVANFHLLLYLAKLFDLNTALSISECVAKETEIDSNMEEILRTIA